ncbi:tyrosine-type recombinase/integrase [Algoriphagus sp. C2-6-M1]|uniref:tyrosine-type recombinase/integrase n=1 Tax=Algoriphagus persicinus TaxID=3108754 RepID=UPI002B3D26D6|nr:tyrosine-type recombinase/integrase [Algoriphagus sp. C2-6-M1]MEB2781481.1 tyrosine-type recombinase/integrase [Algoriphagus sp. C2-6-M1]
MLLKFPLDLELKERIKTIPGADWRHKLKIWPISYSEEVKAIHQAHQNIKHWAVLSLIYASELRRSELPNLTPQDIDSKRRMLSVNQGKDNNDRLVPISDKILELLGHQSSKIQEVHTHVSQKSLQKISNPFDDL